MSSAPTSSRPEASSRQEGWLFDKALASLVDRDPTFAAAMGLMVLLSTLLFTRDLTTNFIYDEQEALLANPYVNGSQNLGFWDAVKRDFWGLPHDETIGSYRPLPNMLWRMLASASDVARAIAPSLLPTSGPPLHPWAFHWVNVVLHAVNGALVTCIVFFVLRRRGLAWMAGFLFVSCAVLTEAVSGLVGIADVLGGLFALLALMALRLPLYAMPLGVFTAMLLGLFSKESALVCVPLVPLAALALAPHTHPRKPLRMARFALSLLATVSGFVLYVSLRKHWFPAVTSPALLEPLAHDAGIASRAMRAFMLWLQQPVLPRDPLNNPLVTADFPHRVAGALRVYAHGLGQVLFPWRLSGDYSFPEEPVPDRLIFPASVIGALAMIVPPMAALAIWLRSLAAERRQRRTLDVSAIEDARLPWRTASGPIIALALAWVVVSYFPHSNIPTLLPTVRAERFWYFPAIGTSVLLAFGFVWLFDRTRGMRRGLPAVIAFSAFFAFQCTKARAHAFDYADDLTFWTATRESSPRSAKAHLNHAVMWGARGAARIRLEGTREALELAPDWGMANIYMGDALCRSHRADEAWPYYERGLRMEPEQPNLVALALQCLWDEKAIEKHADELLAIAGEHPDSWLYHLTRDVVYNGEKFGGVPPRYRPRGYNEGPK